MSNSALRITFAVPDEGADLPDESALSEEALDSLAAARQQAATRVQAPAPQQPARPGPGERDRPPGPRVPLQPGQPLDGSSGAARPGRPFDGSSGAAQPDQPLDGSFGYAQPGRPLDGSYGYAHPTGTHGTPTHGTPTTPGTPAPHGTAAPWPAHTPAAAGAAGATPWPAGAPQAPPVGKQPPASARVIRDGSAVFVLVPDADGYLLPDVVLEQVGAPAHLTAHLPAQVEVQQPEGELLPTLLTNALTRAWSAGEHGAFLVPGVRRISHGARLPLFAVHANASSAASSAASAAASYAPPLQVTVNWRVQYTGSAPDTAHASVVLRLWPPGRPAPEPRAPTPEYLVLRPAPERMVDGLAVAVDFGTTASTVTLLVRPHTGGHLDADQAVTLANRLTALTAPPDDAPRAWRAAVESLRGGQLEIGGPAGDRVPGAVALTRLGDLAVATRVLLWVEEVRAGTEDPELRQWLVEQLHGLVTATVRTPALDLHELGPVEFRYGQGSTTTRAPATLLREVQGNQDRPGVSRGRGRAYELTPEGTEGITGIKRRLLTTPAGRTSDQGPAPAHLAQHVYHLLVEQSERAAHGERPGTPARVSTVLLTFPTSASPAARAELGNLVQRGLSVPHVELLIDEGLAAGLYFVMRDLTGNPDVGLETLRASSRPVPGEPDTWRSIMLVVDIGGGTTDIALLDLILRDLTPPLEAADRFKSGRAYLLEPRILGTIGHGQLGGDLLTLLVLYWVKATLLDQAGKGDPGRTGEGLSERVVREANGNRETLVSPEVRELLRREMPTHWREDGFDLEDVDEARRREVGFSKLWRLAERVKKALGAETGDAELTSDELGDLRQHFEQLKGLPGPVVFSRDEYRALIEPYVRQAAEMAAGLVSDAFRRLSAGARPADGGADASGDGAVVPAPYLDQVVLAGRSSTMPAVRRALTHTLNKADYLHGRAIRKVEWNPERLETETGFLAKQATSLGAAWLNRVKGVVGVFRHESGGMTHSELTVRAQGLFSCLPCDFALQGLAAYAEELFGSGTPFEQRGADGSLGLVSAWRQVVRMPRVVRPRAGSSPLPWGILDVENRARGDGCDMSSPAWDFDHGPEMRFRVCVDEWLNLTAEFLHGPRQHHWIPDSPAADGRDSLSLNGRAGLQFTAHQPTVTVPGDICATTDEWGHPGCVLRDVFPADRRDAGEPLLTYFPDLFHLGARPDPLVEPTPGRITELEFAEDPKLLYFYLRDPQGGDPVYLGRLPVPAANREALSRPVRITLDARGELRLHRGALRAPEAESFLEAEQRPGWVHRVPIEQNTSDYQAGWDPDSGEH